MIQIRMMKQSDMRSVDRMLKETQMKFEQLKLKIDHCYVVEDGERICGLAGYEMTEADRAEMIYLFVRNEDRGFKLGDGLFRAMLNHLDHKKVTQVYIKSDESTNGFFVAEGLDIAMKADEKLVFKAELPEFFNKPCKSSRGNA
ncbi:GNAT family N-acetyltransferase [Fusibacter sp. 3D3]|uniref:GNAT family N-acetyltransferase n=1 Tax=Fusibacter sp. 3D3 TaxID=1048380 RepID=UPI000853300C|nr:GNAT family N-acetyltransferase [Fusibacter sp. 3D3]GAU76984.1 hypothetical protein F3D3_1583 [Fusibacter sp. 3D3]